MCSRPVALQMLWASRSVPPSVIPSDAWHYSTPIAGSPFAVNVLPRERDVRDASMYYLDGISSVIAKVKEWLPPTNATRAKVCTVPHPMCMYIVCERNGPKVCFVGYCTYFGVPG